MLEINVPYVLNQCAICFKSMHHMFQINAPYVSNQCTIYMFQISLRRKMCEQKYGMAPEVKVSGHLSALFSYIPQPLDYILHEMLKNALR